MRRSALHSAERDRQQAEERGSRSDGERAGLELSGYGSGKAAELTSGRRAGRLNPFPPPLQRPPQRQGRHARHPDAFANEEDEATLRELLVR